MKSSPSIHSAAPSLRTTLRDAVHALRAAHATVAVAESCTGGGLGFALTSLAGSSAFFLGGVIAYANAVKMTMLGVPYVTLARHGAVSRPVACAMARGVRARLGATYGVGITGIAGPSGGTLLKPVGTVWIAVAGPRNKTHAICYYYNGSRAAIRRAAIRSALVLLARALRSQ